MGSMAPFPTNGECLESLPLRIDTNNNSNVGWGASGTKIIAHFACTQTRFGHIARRDFRPESYVRYLNDLVDAKKNAYLDR